MTLCTDCDGCGRLRPCLEAAGHKSLHRICACTYSTRDCTFTCKCVRPAIVLSLITNMLLQTRERHQRPPSTKASSALKARGALKAGARITDNLLVLKPRDYGAQLGAGDHPGPQLSKGSHGVRGELAPARHWQLPNCLA
jgi:hypothetical protein